MNLKNKIFVRILSALLGVFMIFSGVGGFMAMNSMEGIPADMVASTQVLIDTGIFHMIKVTEIVVGLMLLVGFLPALAAIFLAPISVGIVIFNLRISPETLPVALVVFLLNIWLGYVYFDKYKAIFSRK